MLHPSCWRFASWAIDVTMQVMATASGLPVHVLLTAPPYHHTHAGCARKQLHPPKPPWQSWPSTPHHTPTWHTWHTSQPHSTAWLPQWPPATPLQGTSHSCSLMAQHPRHPLLVPPGVPAGRAAAGTARLLAAMAAMVSLPRVVLVLPPLCWRCVRLGWTSCLASGQVAAMMVVMLVG